MKTRRYSKQRELIYTTLCQTKEHPSAEMLYRWLKPTCPQLSLGTVYRNLSLLAEDGLIHRLPFPVDRFDADVKRHPHFYCAQCTAVYDIPVSDEKRLDDMARRSGHEIHDHEIVFRGICVECKRKNELLKKANA